MTTSTCGPVKSYSDLEELQTSDSKDNVGDNVKKLPECQPDTEGPSNDACVKREL